LGSRDGRFKLPDPETEIIWVRTKRSKKKKRKRKGRIGKEGERREKGRSRKKS
jgi:hypothetical protein